MQSLEGQLALKRERKASEISFGRMRTMADVSFAVLLPSFGFVVCQSDQAVPGDPHRMEDRMRKFSFDFARFVESRGAHQSPVSKEKPLDQQNGGILAEFVLPADQRPEA